ncbi:MAG: hypothetical protein JWM88_2479 [Verrucomicrobia bacterium]|nr:hypothetical protein [Verrucomicrobiota bacterium]
MPRKDYIPDSPRNQRDWSQNFVAQFPAVAKRIGWSDADIKALMQRVTRLQEAAQTVVNADSALDVALGELETVRDAEVSEIRLDVANLKKTRGFTEGDGRIIEVLSSATTFDAATCQPKLQPEEKRGRVRLMAKKLGADSLNIYMRRKGEGEFRLLASKRVRFPFDDDTPGSIAGQPEEREYQATGVIGDDEIGKPSDIVTAVWRS